MFYLSIIGASILIIGLFLSFVISRKNQTQELDRSMSTTTYKHRILANPGLIAYASIILIAIVVIGYFAISHSKWGR